MFFEIFVEKGDTGHFLRNNGLCMNTTIFINKRPSFLEVVVLILQFKSIYQRNENKFIKLVLKAKQQKVIQIPFIFLKFHMNQFSNQFLLFLHFSGL